MRRSLFHPLTSLVLLALLLADALLLSEPTLGHSTAGAFIREHIRHANLPVTRPWSPPAALFIRSTDKPGDFRILRPDEESWDEATRQLRDHPRDCLLISWRPITIRRGFWAPTTAIDKHTVTLQFGENFSDPDRAAARRRFVEESGAAQHFSRAEFVTLTTTDIDRTRALPLGYLHNALAALTAILFLLSLRWVPRTPAYFRSRLAAGRLARGLCPRCSYNLRGLREPKCPECGTPLPVATP